MENPGPKFESRKERIDDKLNRLLGDISIEQNDYFAMHGGNRYILNADSSVNMQFFPFPPSEIQADEEEVHKKEAEFSNANNPNWQKHLKENFNIEGEQAIINYFKEERGRQASSRLEKGVVIVFYKILKGQFAAAKSSAHDDYFNYIDTLLVDMETGGTHCTFDEVHDAEGGKKHEKKERDIIRTAKDGGAKIKYGFAFENNSKTGERKFVQKEISGLPRFYLRLANSELYGLLNGLGNTIEENPTDIELEIFDKLISSLEEQARLIRVRVSVNKKTEKVFENLTKFEESLARMKEIKTERFGAPVVKRAA